MRKIVIYIINSIFVLFILTGCAEKKSLDLLPVVKEKEKSAQIYVIRPDRFQGSLANVSLYIDNKHLTILQNAEYTIIDLDFGKHSIDLKFRDLFEYKSVAGEIKFELNEKNSRYFIMASQGVFSSKFIEISKTEASFYINSLKYVVP